MPSAGWLAASLGGAAGTPQARVGVVQVEEAAEGGGHG